MKLKKIIAPALFLFLMIPQTTRGENPVFKDDYTFDELFTDPAILQHLNETTYEFTRTVFDPFDTIDILDEVMNIRSLLRENLFLRTNPLNSRDVLDLPMGMLDKNYEYNNWLSSVGVFWNMTDRSYFSRGCDSIRAYLALTQEDFLEEVREASQKVKDFEIAEFDFDPADAFILFKNGTVQERRFGLLFYGRKALRNWNFSWKFPFYYLERNFWFTEKEQEEIEKLLGALDEDEQEKFQSEHMISDKLGFGDLRFSFDFPLSKNENFSARIGAFITVPTAWAVAKGLKGSKFCPVVGNRETDLKELINYHLNELFTIATDGTTTGKETVLDSLTDLAYMAIDHTASHLLDVPLGNGRHTGFGVHFSSRTPLNFFIQQRWADNIVMKSFMSLEYLLPATETRFFREQIDVRALDMLPFDDEDKATENMIFLEQQIVNKLFPYACDTTVYPGLVFKWTSKATYETDRWGMHLGTDMWVKSSERLYDIKAEGDLGKRLDIYNGVKLRGYQSKVLGSVFFKVHKDNRDWTISIDGDATLMRSGIGGDYTISLNLEVDF